MKLTGKCVVGDAAAVYCQQLVGEVIGDASRVHTAKI
jgi:hypothetical protein